MTILIKSLVLNVFTFCLMSSGGSITGNVVDENMQAVSGAQVELIQNNEVTFSAVIDGEFTFENVPTGTYTLEVCKTGYVCTIMNGVQVTQGQVDLGDSIIEEDTLF